MASRWVVVKSRIDLYQEKLLSFEWILMKLFGRLAVGACRLFSEKGEKLKTVDFDTGAGTYTVNTRKGSYNRCGDRVETLGTNMYFVLLLSLAELQKLISFKNVAAHMLD